VLKKRARKTGAQKKTSKKGGGGRPCAPASDYLWVPDSDQPSKIKRLECPVNLPFGYQRTKAVPKKEDRPPRFPKKKTNRGGLRPRKKITRSNKRPVPGFTLKKNSGRPH